MRDELEMQLQNDFSFMWQKHEKGQDIYRRWGCECSDGWYGIIHDACQAIADAYDDVGIPVDFVPAQIKEKFGTLRFYYGFEDAPCGIAAFDNLADGTSIRFAPEGVNEDIDKKEFRNKIREIIREAEERSKYTCEICGCEEGKIRNDQEHGIYRVQTLCDDCHKERIKCVQEQRERRKNMSPEERLAEIKEGMQGS
ncbi:MAG: hypothetical protein J5574_00615 [Lachnospiraceae bacterium]|nr:hypothetical protein [Lachnospiraceae bacterium]